MNLNLEALQQMATAYAVQYGMGIIGALLVFIIGRWCCSAIKKVVTNLLTKSKIDVTVTAFVANITYWAAYLFVIVAALAQIGIQTASFVAIFGAAGLAIGLALQGSLSNFASGVMIIIFRPFKVGDYIMAAGVGGTVTGLQIFNTVLTTPDNKVIFVPNAQITGSSITNASANSTRRIDMVIGVSYDDDIDGVRKTISDIVTSDVRVLKDKDITIAVGELGDNSVNFFVRPWVNSPDYWTTLFDLQANIKKGLEKNGYSIPYPQRDVHIYNEK